MTSYLKNNAAAIGIILLFSPMFAYAQQTGNNPPPDAGKDTNPSKSIVYVCTSGAPGECTWDDVIAAVKHLVNWGVEFALTFSVIVIAVAGFKYMTSEGSPGKLAEANKMFASVAKGIVIIMAAWLIVTLITGALLNHGINTFLK